MPRLGTWSGGSSGSRPSTASPARSGVSVGSRPTRSRATCSAGSCPGAAPATSSCATAPGSTSTSAATPSTPRRVRLDRAPRHARQGGERILEGLLVDAERRLQEEGIAGDVYLFKNNTDSAGNSYGCHENYLVGRHGEFPPRRHADPVPRLAPDHRRRREGAADAARRGLLREPARGAHLGGRLERHHALAPDHQHPRRAARRRRALPPPARHRRRLEHERDDDDAQGRTDRPRAADARARQRACAT